MYRTFDEWSNMGYRILKDSKATIRDGKPKFSETQVRKTGYSGGDWYDEYPHGDGYDAGGPYGLGVDW